MAETDDLDYILRNLENLLQRFWLFVLMGEKIWIFFFTLC